MKRSALISISLASALVAAACAPSVSEDGSRQEAEVVGQDGQGSGLETFEIRQLGRRFVVRLFDRGAGQRVVTVAARSYRGVDRADLRVAFSAASEAGLQVSCGNEQGLRVLPDSARFQEAGRRSAFTSGEAAWVFQGRCG